MDLASLSITPWSVYTFFFSDMIAPYGNAPMEFYGEPVYGFDKERGEVRDNIVTILNMINDKQKLNDSYTTKVYLKQAIEQGFIRKENDKYELTKIGKDLLKAWRDVGSTPTFISQNWDLMSVSRGMK